MASSKKPGGGVANGAMAQEECLFRCSNLFEISTDFYPLSKDEALYTKDAVFIKDKNYMIMEEPVILDVVTIAALNLNHMKTPDNYDEIMINKIKLMLSLALKNGCKNIILGAWGCGVFKNDPIRVSKLFEEFAYGDFDNIVYAVINDHNSVSNNYEIFKNTLNK